MTSENYAPNRLVETGFVTVEEAADFLSVARSTLYKLMDSGKLAYWKVDGTRSRRIPRQALLDLAMAGLRGGWLSEAMPSPGADGDEQ